MTKDQTRAIALASGFTIKDGQDELKEYVYEFAKALLNSVDQRSDVCKRKINTILEPGEYKQIHGATVLVNKDGLIAIVNKGGAFYWADNDAIKWEFENHSCLHDSP